MTSENAGSCNSEVNLRNVFLLAKTNSFGRIFNKLTSFFYASVLLLIMNFVITLSKWLWIHEAIAEWIRRLI